MLRKHRQLKFLKYVDKLHYEGMNIREAISKVSNVLHREDKERVDRWLERSIRYMENML